MNSITLTRKEMYDLHTSNKITVWRANNHGDAGDRLWVKEPYRILDATSGENELTVVYTATSAETNDEWIIKVDTKTWERHSRHNLNIRKRSARSMPRWACRRKVTIVTSEQHQRDGVTGYLITVK